MATKNIEHVIAVFFFQYIKACYSKRCARKTLPLKLSIKNKSGKEIEKALSWSTISFNGDMTFQVAKYIKRKPV